MSANTGIDTGFEAFQESMMEDRYLMKLQNGYEEKTWDDICRRVSRVVASSNVSRISDIKRLQGIETTYYRIMKARLFIPNSPSLFNAGINQSPSLLSKPTNEMTLSDYEILNFKRDPMQQLSACFAGDVEDSLDSIMDVAKDMAMIIKSAGGFGINLSKLRPEGAFVHGTFGSSSGPLSFLHVYDAIMQVVKAGYKRRGAGMALMDLDHPDIFKFIDAKEGNTGESVLSGFNLSVSFPYKVINSRSAAKHLRQGKDIFIPWSHGGRGETSLSKLIDAIAYKAWYKGDPGAYFMDKANETNPMVNYEPFRACNPCGEQSLHAWSSCNLGAINLLQFVDYSLEPEDVLLSFSLLELISIATQFLDDTLDATVFPVDKIRDKTLNLRPIGLGVFGFADFLTAYGIPYSSERAIKLGKMAAEILEYHSSWASVNLAHDRGAFPLFSHSEYAKDINFHPKHGAGEVFSPKQWKQLAHAESLGKRNVLTTTIAPTGSTAALGGASYGIEPHYSLTYTRKFKNNKGEWKEADLIPSGVAIFMENQGFDKDEALSVLRDPDTYKDIYPEVFAVCETAMDIGYMDHLRMADAFQTYISNSISKTINMANDVSVADVKEAFLWAMESNMHGVTIYRDGSLDIQVLNTKERAEDKEETVSEETMIEENELVCSYCGGTEFERIEGCLVCSTCGNGMCG